MLIAFNRVQEELVEAVEIIMKLVWVCIDQPVLEFDPVDHKRLLSGILNYMQQYCDEPTGFVGQYCWGQELDLVFEVALALVNLFVLIEYQLEVFLRLHVLNFTLFIILVGDFVDIACGVKVVFEELVVVSSESYLLVYQLALRPVEPALVARI